jgi:SAM-dependent methyltransferase
MLPSPLQSVARKVYWSALDWVEESTHPGEVIPPRRLRFIGAGDFRGVGREFMRYFIEYGQITPTSKILDVGSGIGRMALPLLPFIGSKGSYDGLEIVRSGVDWCQQNITPRYPQFQFHWADVYNKEYTPQGRFQAHEYLFPFPDNHFDFVFLTSVFTHMLPRDLEHYMSEVARVMKPRGRCLATFFLLNDESLASIERGGLVLNFVHQGEGYRTTNATVPEEAIAYPEPFVRALIEKCALVIEEPIHYGSWCNRPKYLSFQDIIIAEKPQVHPAGLS